MGPIRDGVTAPVVLELLRWVLKHATHSLSTRNSECASPAPPATNGEATMTKPIAILILLVSPALLRAYDFKGIEIGKTADIALIEKVLIDSAIIRGNPSTKKDTDKSCGDKARDDVPRFGLVKGERWCTGHTTVAETVAHASIVIALDGTVQRIGLTFDSELFEQVERAVLGKFGDPTATENPTVTNRMGGTFIQIEHTWQDDDGNLVLLKKYAGSLDDSQLSFASAAELKKLEERAKERSEDL